MKSDNVLQTAKQWEKVKLAPTNKVDNCDVHFEKNLSASFWVSSLYSIHFHI